MALQSKTRSKSRTRHSPRVHRPGETTKVTFVLPSAMVEQLKEAVATGEATSQTALAREALEREFKRRREMQLEEAYRVAAADPMWRQDTEGTMAAFEPLDAETSHLLPEEDW